MAQNERGGVAQVLVFLPFTKVPFWVPILEPQPYWWQMMALITGEGRLETSGTMLHVRERVFPDFSRNTTWGLKRPKWKLRLWPQGNLCSPEPSWENTAAADLNEWQVHLRSENANLFRGNCMVAG